MDVSVTRPAVTRGRVQGRRQGIGTPHRTQSFPSGFRCHGRYSQAVGLIGGLLSKISSETAGLALSRWMFGSLTDIRWGRVPWARWSVRVLGLCTAIGWNGQPPNTTACIFWLKNRRKDRWRDVQNIDSEVGHYILSGSADV
jgi:hypothetical protein